jgi:hypothetical protein
MLVEPHKSNFLEQVSDLWSGLSHHKNRFPGPNPCSIEKSDFEVIRRQEYKNLREDRWVQNAADRLHVRGVQAGHAHLEGLGCLRDPVEKVSEGVVPGHCPGWRTCADQRGEWVWMGFDAIIVGGIPVYRDPLEDRLEALRRSMHCYRHSPGEVELRLKSYYNTLEEYQQYLPGLQHNVDGIILTPARLGITVGRHRQMYKLKNAGDHTVDFCTRKTVCMCMTRVGRSTSVLLR